VVDKTILVTGGCGFIGSNFLHMLDAIGWTGLVVNVDALTYAGRLENLEGLNLKNYKFFPYDINNPILGAVFDATKPDVVVNFAAESHVDRSITGPDIFLKTNIVGTGHLLDLSVKNNVKQFIQISTDEVYGDLDNAAPESVETDNLAPSSPYSASKASADLLALSYARTYGLHVNVTRCSNNYGPRQFPEKLLPLMISKARNNEKLPIYGDGQQIRDWIHVTDHCDGVLSVIESGKSGEIYNFGGDNELPNMEVVDSILTALDKPQSLKERVTDRLGHDRRYAINFSKATKDLGWVPKTDWVAGLANTIRWYEEEDVSAETETS